MEAASETLGAGFFNGAIIIAGRSTMPAGRAGRNNRVTRAVRHFQKRLFGVRLTPAN
jgi:hypothetical protein